MNSQALALQGEKPVHLNEDLHIEAASQLTESTVSFTILVLYLCWLVVAICEMPMPSAKEIITSLSCKLHFQPLVVADVLVITIGGRQSLPFSVKQIQFSNGDFFF